MSSYLSLLPDPPGSHLAVEGHHDELDTQPDEQAPTLRLLEPTPVGEFLGADDKPGHDYDSSASQSTFSNTSHLGLTSHSLVYYLKRIQKYSSLTFAAFAALHVTNTAVLPLVTGSAFASNKYLLLTRPYYQSALAEPLVVAIPLAAHIASGVALRIHRLLARRRWSGSRSITSMVQSTSVAGEDSQARAKIKARSVWEDLPPLSWIALAGYLSVPLVYGHMMLTRGLPLLVEGSSAGIGLDFVGHGVALGDHAGSSGLAGRLVRGAGVVGLVSLVGVAASHAVWGLATWLGVLPPLLRSSSLPFGSRSRPATRLGSVSSTPEAKLKYKKRWWTVLGVNFLVVGIWIAGGVGVVARSGRVGGWVGRAYDEMYRKVPLVRLALPQ